MARHSSATPLIPLEAPPEHSELFQRTRPLRTNCHRLVPVWQELAGVGGRAEFFGDGVPRSRRAGLVLLIVLVVVAMLALGAYSFTLIMDAEARSAQSFGRAAQARQAADSGVHYVVATLNDQTRQGVLGTELFDSRGKFNGRLVTEPAEEELRCRFSVVAAHPNSGSETGSIRFGVDDESAKVNLNVTPDLALQRAKVARVWIEEEGIAELPDRHRGSNPLLDLPNMTREIADAILDWIDPDDEPRERGAESGYYLGLAPPYRARNGPLESLDELMLVRGVTARHLYGEDANQNGILDPNENDGSASYPVDNGDGRLDRGWLPYLTVYSRDSGLDSAGLPRINLNQEDVSQLYDELAADPDFGESAARFIVAYRLFGVAGGGDPGSEGLDELGGPDPAGTIPGGSRAPDSSRGARPAPGTPARGRSDPGNTAGSRDPAEREETLDDEEEPIVAGLDASAGVQFDIESFVDLLDIAVEADLPDTLQPVRLASPFRSGASNDALDRWLDRTTTREFGRSMGLVNVNTASRAALMALPGMTEERADEIVGYRTQRLTGTGDPMQGGTGWLLTSGIMSRDEFKRMEPFLTGRGQVFRMQVIGYFDGYGTYARSEAVIDMSGPSARIRHWRDLSPLGRGYASPLLEGVGSTSEPGSGAAGLVGSDR